MKEMKIVSGSTGNEGKTTAPGRNVKGVKADQKVEKSAKKSTFEWRVTIKSYVQPKPQCKLVFPLKMVSSIHIP